jgi:hypothetical protein
MGVTTTLTAAKLGASLSAWTIKTYEQIAAAAALRAANIALLESELASSGAKVTQLTATEAAIVAERQLVLAKLAAARANIVSAEAAISAASAAGAQSFALRTLQLATTELAVAETQRAAMMAELAILGRQQASVSTQLAAAKAAEAAAQLGLNAATSAGTAAAGLATRALGFLGGPVGALITVLGLAAVAWSHWGGTAKEASESAKGATEDSFATIIKGLDAQIDKHEALIRLRKQGMSLDAAQKVDQKPLNELGSLSSQLNALNAGTGLPSGSSKEDYFFKRQEVLQKILELNTKINKEQTTGAEATSLTQAEARAKFMTDYATKAEQLAAKLAEARKLLGSAFTSDDEARIRKAYEVTDQSAKQEQTAYKNLMTSIQEKIAANRLEMSGYHQLSESQKLTIALDAEIATGKTKLGARDIESARSQIAVVAATDAVVASNKRAKAGAEEYTKMVRAHDDQVAKSIQSANDEAAKNEELVVTFGKSKAAIEQLELSRLQDQLAQRAATGLTLDEIASLEKLIDAKKRNVAAVTRVEDMTTAQKGAEELAQFLDPTRAQDFGDALKGAFNGAGDAISKMTKVLDDFGRKSAQIEKQRGNAANAYLNGLTDEKTYLSELSQISRKDTQERLGGYGDMASAAAGFFGEQSKGYKVLTTVSQVFHAAELAMTLAELVPKGISAVLSQGQGDPYSAFARMAAMAAIVTGLGVAISGGGGGGGGQSAADVQKAQGTGSVFGDSSAKSDSIRRSIEQMTANSSDMLPINQGMLTALQNIESSMTGLTNLVVRTTGLTDGANMGIQTGTIATGGPVALAGSAQVGSMIGGALAGPLGVWIGGAIGGAVSKLWGKTTQNIVDSGLQYGGSVRSLQAGQGFDQYASIDTTKSSWFGLSKSTSNRIEVQGLNDELSKQFGLIFTNLDKSLQAAATAMGGSAADVTKVLDSLTLESTKVSLKGLTGTALTDALNSVISKSMDEIAEAAFPQLDQFRTVGEGYAETVMRLAGDYAKLDSILAASSTTFGATGIASIAAREHLIELAGGIDQLASQTNSFTQNFLSKAEQLAPVQKYVTDQLAAMGLQSLDTRDKFKDYLLGLANSGALATDAGAQQYTALLALADAFAKTHAATVDLTKSEQEITDERTDLQNKLDELTMTQAQLADKARAAIDGHNQALYDQVTAAQKAADIASANADYQKQVDQLLAARQGEAAVRALEIAGLDATTIALYDRVAALKAEDALASTNAGYQKQIDDFLKSSMSAAQVRALETKGMDASTLALYDRLAGLKAEQTAQDAIKKAQEQAAATMASFGDALAGSMKAATDAAAAFRALNDALLIGDSSALNPEQKYLEAKRQFDTADGSNLEAAEKAFLDASKSWFGGSAGYAADFAAVIAKNTQFAAASDAQAAAIPGIWALIQKQMLGVDGSHKNGLDFVPFDGYRAELHRGERVQTAASVRDGDAANQKMVGLLQEVLTELRADKVQRGAVGTATIEKIDKMADKMDAQKRATRASAREKETT